MALLRDTCAAVALVVCCIAAASAEDFDGLCLTQQRTLVYRAEPDITARARRSSAPPGDGEARRPATPPEDSLADSLADAEADSGADSEARRPATPTVHSAADTEAHRPVTPPAESEADSEASRSITSEVDDEAGPRHKSIAPLEDAEARRPIMSEVDDETGPRHRPVTPPVDGEARRPIVSEVDDEAGPRHRSVTPPEDDEARRSLVSEVDDEAGARHRSATPPEDDEVDDEAGPRHQPVTPPEDDEARRPVRLSEDDEAGTQKKSVALSDDDEAQESAAPPEDDDDGAGADLPVAVSSLTPPGTGEEEPGPRSPNVVNHLQELVMQFQQEKQLFREDRQRWSAEFEDAKAAWQAKYDQLKEEADTELRKSRLNYEDWYKANMSIVLETRVNLQAARDKIRKQDLAIAQLEHANKQLVEEKTKMNQTGDEMMAEIANLKLIKLERETYEADNRDLSERLKTCQTDKANEERQHATDNDKRLSDIKDMMKKANAANITAEGLLNKLRLNVQFMREKYDECTFKRSQCEDQLGHGKNSVDHYTKALHNITVQCALEKQRLTDQADTNVQSIAKHLEEQIAKSALEKEETMKECQTQMITVNQENKQMSVDLRKTKGENDEIKQVVMKLQLMVKELEEKAEARFTVAYNSATERITADARNLEGQLRQQLAEVNEQKEALGKHKQEFLRSATSKLMDRKDALEVQNQNMTGELQTLRAQVTKLLAQLDTEHRSFAEKLQEAKLDGVAMEKTRQEKAAGETIKEKTDGMYHLLMEARKAKGEMERQLAVIKSQNQRLRSQLAGEQVGYQR